MQQLTNASTNALNKIHPEACIKFLHVSAPGCHHQGVILNKGVQGQDTYLDKRAGRRNYIAKSDLFERNDITLLGQPWRHKH